MNQLKDSEINAAIRDVLKRSVADPEFRALALKDGAAAVAKVAGKPLPHGTTLSFVSNEGKSEKLVMLPDPVTSADTLTEEELEQVAGGLAACGASTCATTG